MSDEQEQNRPNKGRDPDILNSEVALCRAARRGVRVNVRAVPAATSLFIATEKLWESAWTMRRRRTPSSKQADLMLKRSL